MPDRITEFLAESKRIEAILPEEVWEEPTVEWILSTLPRMREALEAVLFLHPPVETYWAKREPGAGHPAVCMYCGETPYPCPTVRSIEAALMDEGE